MPDDQSIAPEPVSTTELGAAGDAFWDQYLDAVPDRRRWSPRMVRRIAVVGVASLLVLGVIVTSGLRDRSSDARSPGQLVPVTADETFGDDPTMGEVAPGSPSSPGSAGAGSPSGSASGSRTGSRTGSRSGSSGMPGMPSAPGVPGDSGSAPAAPGGGAAPAAPGGASAPAPPAPAPAAARTLGANERTVFGPDVSGGGDNGSDQDGNLELGMRFSTSTAGSAVGIFLYQSEWSNGQHVGTLWGPGGSALARVTFSGETGERWKRANFSTPVTLTPGTTYTVSYSVTDGSYWSITNRFDNETVNGPLRAPAATNNGNGVFGNLGSYPTETCGIQYCPTPLHYFVDVIFVPA